MIRWQSRQSGCAGESAKLRVPICKNALLNHDENCANCCLKNILSADQHVQPELERIQQIIGNLDFRANAALYREGDTGTNLYSLRFGVVKLIQHLPNGSDRIVRLMRKGDVMGLEILCCPVYQHTAIALVKTNVCRIPSLAITELERHDPRLHDELLLRWESNLERADMWITQLSTGPAGARLARLIRFIKQRDSATPDNLVALPHREDIGSMLGVTTETVCRAMSNFQTSGVLRRINDNLFEFDPIRIEKLADD